MTPPSAVLNRRPSAVVTVAIRASTALTAIRSTSSGNATRWKRRPSVDSTTVPLRPTSQQTEDEGEAPAVSPAETPVESVCQVDPLSFEYSTEPGGPRRQRFDRSGDPISADASFAMNVETESRDG